MARRSGIAWALVVVLAIFVMIGILYGVLYYGGMIPVYNNITLWYGTSIFDSPTLTLYLTVGTFWMFIVTGAVIFWLWQRSQKRDLESF